MYIIPICLVIEEKNGKPLNSLTLGGVKTDCREKRQEKTRYSTDVTFHCTISTLDLLLTQVMFKMAQDPVFFVIITHNFSIFAINFDHSIVNVCSYVPNSQA